MSASSKRRRTAAVFKPGKFECVNCRREVRGETHVRHKDRDEFALCVDCYSVGVEIKGVRWGPDTVRLIDTSTTRMPLLVEDWAAEQEVRLLEGILQFGFGNWRAVAEYMSFEKTEQECEEHYERFYVRSSCFPLPDLSGPPESIAGPSTGGGGAAEDAAAGAAGAAAPASAGAAGAASAPAGKEPRTGGVSPVADAAAPTAAGTTDLGAAPGGGGGGARPNPKPKARGASGLLIEGGATPVLLRGSNT
jgi:hypothetical protein